MPIHVLLAARGVGYKLLFWYDSTLLTAVEILF